MRSICDRVAMMLSIGMVSYVSAAVSNVKEQPMDGCADPLSMLEKVHQPYSYLPKDFQKQARSLIQRKKGEMKVSDEARARHDGQLVQTLSSTTSKVGQIWEASGGTCQWVEIKLTPDIEAYPMADWEVDNERSGDCDAEIYLKTGFCQCSETDVAAFQIHHPNKYERYPRPFQTCREACTKQEKSRYRQFPPRVRCPPGTLVQDIDECEKALKDLGYWVEENPGLSTVRKYEMPGAPPNCATARDGRIFVFNDLHRYSEELMEQQWANGTRPPAGDYYNVCAMPTPQPTPSPTPMPTSKTCFSIERNFPKLLGYAGIRTNEDGERNTCIDYNARHSKSDVQHYQGMGDWENQGAIAAIITLRANGYSDADLEKLTEEDQRNTLIVMTSHCTEKSADDLQKEKTIKIAEMMNKDGCCP